MAEVFQMGTGSAAADANKPEDRDHGGQPVRKKKRGAMQLIRVALYLLRHRRSKSKLVHQMGVNENKGLWNKLLGSMRPLHLQSNQSPPPPHPLTTSDPLPLLPPAVDEQVVVVVVEEVFTPSPCSPMTCSSNDGMSQYESALNLQELDPHGESEETDEEYDDDEEVYEDNGGDEMIDAKAEEFIAKFYAQIRIQNKAYNDRYNARMHS